jgi:uncharacterized SAM-binding protein YcdF (DUF218 family)
MGNRLEKKWLVMAVRLMMYLLVLLSVTCLNIQTFGARDLFKSWMGAYLIKTSVWTPLQVGPVLVPNHAIYVLGGSRISLEKRFKTAAELYRRNVGTKILFLSQAGIMEYSPLSKRNLSYNEWGVGKLKDLGVRIQDIEPVSISDGFWGTFLEAKEISQVASERGYSGLVLVTSPYHTQRTWASFVRFSGDLGLKVYIYPSDDEVPLSQLLQESVKLLIYKVFLV